MGGSCKASYTALLNQVAGLYIVSLVPEFLLRFVALVLARCLFRLRVVGDEHLPVSGAAIVVCNHVSLVDALLLMAASPRPMRFIMDRRIFAVPVLGCLFGLAKAIPIPIAPQAEDPQAYAAAFDAADRVLAEGKLLCIFPEGGISRDGTLQPFKVGVMKILARRPVPVVPVALQNLWGSCFSRIERAAARCCGRCGAACSARSAWPPGRRWRPSCCAAGCWPWLRLEAADAGAGAGAGARGVAWRAMVQGPRPVFPSIGGPPCGWR